VAALLAAHPRVRFRRHVWPLLAKEICWGYYQELFTGHPERTTMAWPAFAGAYAEVTWGSAAFDALVESAVPREDDRIDLDRLDRPLRGRRFATDGELQDHLIAYVEGDLARRSDPAHSADLGAFMALLSSFRQLARVVASGQLGGRSRVDEMDGWWFGFFSYLASGPPPDRLEQLVALARAGVVHFLGGDLEVAADAATGRFVARGGNGPAVVEAVGLIEARLPKANVGGARDELVRCLVDRGEGVEERLPDEDDGDGISTGRLMVSAEKLRLLDRNGQPHPRRVALGAHTSRAAAGAFSRPRTNAPTFPNAELIVSATEYKWWTDPGRVEKLPEPRKPLGTRINAAFPGWKNFKLIEGEQEVAPGIRLVNAPGHTPGHAAFHVSSGSQQLMISNDTAYVPALLAPHPDWQGAYDQDGPLAVESRRKLIDRVIAEKMMICGAHFPFPGAGAFAKDGGGYAFTPVKA